MVVHAHKVLTNVLSSGRQLSKKEAFAAAVARTSGAVRPRKLEKTWKRLREEGRIARTPSKRFVAA